MFRIWSVWIILVASCATVTPDPAWAQAPRQLVSDSSDVAKLFGQFCLTGEPSLAALQMRARDLGGAMAVDHTVPHGNKRQEHYQAWVVRRGNSMYQITADEGQMPVGDKHAVACGLTASNADGADLARALATGLGLGAPAKRVPAIGVAGNSAVWNRNLGEHAAKIRLTWGAQGQDGATIHMIVPNLPAQAQR